MVNLQLLTYLYKYVTIQYRLSPLIVKVGFMPCSRLSSGLATEGLFSSLRGIKLAYFC